jgi:SAM-dependent methyltransferase
MLINALSATTKTVFVDYRPLRVHLANLDPVAADITRLPFADGSIPSLSCLHVIEHVGLGRYGDSLDAKGSEKGAFELQRVLKPGGRLYLSVPVGRQKVCFNAHRVFAPSTILSLLPALKLCGFALVDDVGRFREDVSIDAADGQDYACGMFEFVKSHA